MRERERERERERLYLKLELAVVLVASELLQERTTRVRRGIILGMARLHLFERRRALRRDRAVERAGARLRLEDAAIVDQAHLVAARTGHHEAALAVDASEVRALERVLLLRLVPRRVVVGNHARHSTAVEDRVAVRRWYLLRLDARVLGERHHARGVTDAHDWEDGWVH